MEVEQHDMRNGPVMQPQARRRFPEPEALRRLPSSACFAGRNATSERVSATGGSLGQVETWVEQSWHYPVLR